MIRRPPRSTLFPYTTLSDLLRPPSPSPRSVTVVSPPVMTQAGGFSGRPACTISLAMAACIRAISRVSPSTNVESTSVRKPNWRARAAAASTARRLLPITTLCTRAKIGSPCLGVSGIRPRQPRSMRSRTEAGTRWRIPYLSKMERASANVEASGAVGPEPITSRFSPITSSALNALANGGGHALEDPVLVQDGASERERRGVRRGRAGADHVEIIADHVGEQQREDLRGIGQARQLAAFDLGDVLADCVDLVNAGAAGQQQFCNFLFFVERDGIGGQRQEGGRAAGDQAEHQVVRTGAGGYFGDTARAIHTALVGHGMAAFIDRKST